VLGALVEAVDVVRDDQRRIRAGRCGEQMAAARSSSVCAASAMTRASASRLDPATKLAKSGSRDGEIPSGSCCIT